MLRALLRSLCTVEVRCEIAFTDTTTQDLRVRVLLQYKSKSRPKQYTGNFLKIYVRKYIRVWVGWVGFDPVMGRVGSGLTFKKLNGFGLDLKKIGLGLGRISKPMSDLEQHAYYNCPGKVAPHDGT